MFIAAEKGHRNPVLILAFALLAALSVATIVTPQATAQSAADAAKIAAGLQPDSRAVIARLSDLHELPDGPWKMHAGDLAHGEAANIDDSAWQAITPGSKAPNDSVWLRQTFEVPQTLKGYDLTGARI